MQVQVPPWPFASYLYWANDSTLLSFSFWKVDIKTTLKVYLPPSGRYTWNSQRLFSNLLVLLTVCPLVIPITPMALIAIFAQAPHQFLSLTQISSLICLYRNSAAQLIAPRGCHKWSPSSASALPNMALFQVLCLSELLSLTTSSPHPQSSIHQQLLPSWPPETWVPFAPHPRMPHCYKRPPFPISDIRPVGLPVFREVSAPLSKSFSSQHPQWSSQTKPWFSYCLLLKTVKWLHRSHGGDPNPFRRPRVPISARFSSCTLHFVLHYAPISSSTGHSVFQPLHTPFALSEALLQLSTLPMQTRIFT